MNNQIFLLPRWILAGLSCSLLLLLIIYSIIEGSKVEKIKKDILNHPLQHSEMEIKLGFLKIDDIYCHEITAHDSQRSYRFIVSPSMGIMKGEIYSLIGMITPSGKIKIKEIQHHPHRLYKYLFSGSSVLIVLYLIYKSIRIQRKGWYLTVINEEII